MKFIIYFYPLILSIFLISCQTLEIKNITKTKVQTGRPNSPSFYEYEIFLTVKKGDVVFSKIIINNTIEKEEFSVKDGKTKTSSMNTQTFETGTYILSYKIKTEETSSENDLFEIVFLHKGKEKKIKPTTHLSKEKKLK